MIKRNCWGNVAAGMKEETQWLEWEELFSISYFWERSFTLWRSVRRIRREKKQQELLASVAVGDTILTSSGFYGVINDMTDDTVHEEFGSNKNCRIPMQKAAIIQVEKLESK